MGKISITGIKARDAALKGAEYLVKTVGQTLGPFGLNVLLEKGGRITNDGYTVSKELAPAITDEFERRGALTIHEASAKTNDQVGDATSSAEVLAMSIVKEALRFLPTEGSFASKKKPSEIIDMIRKEKEEVFTKLEKMAKPIKTEKELIASAKVSVEDDELAGLIGKAQYAMGKNGIIIAEETNDRNSSVDNIKGIRIDNGLGTSYIMNNQEKQSLEAGQCRTILTSYVLQDFRPLEKIIDQLVKSGQRNIVIVARGFSSDCIRLVVENIKNGVNFYPLNAPYTNMKEIMKDLEAVLGGRFIDTEEGRLEDITLADVGYCSKVIAKRYDAIIAGEENNLTKANVELRVEALEKELKGETSDFAKKALEARISQLTNGFSVLKVGADTEVERKRKKDKCDDAVNAVRLAYQGGTVKGAGLAFKEISDGMPETSILKRPLNSIYEQIMSSAPEGFVVEEWVRDPLLVLKAALENACSVAGVFAMINGIVCEENPTTCSCSKAQE